MYYSQSEIVNLKLMADAAKLNSDKIKDLIESDLRSEVKRRMQEGTNYYNTQHDILNRVRTYTIDGVVETDTKSNEKLPHPFHKILVDQKTSYIVGNPVVVGVQFPEVLDEKNLKPDEEAAFNKADEFESAIIDELDERFDDTVNDWATGSSNKSVEWVHFYVTPPDGQYESELRYIVCPAEQIIPIYDTQYEDRLLGIIRYYIIQVVKENGDKLNRYKVEWWTDQDVTYYAQNEAGNFLLDTSYGSATLGHFYTFNTIKPTEKIQNSWGRIPFIPLYNNSHSKTDLEAIKALIDAYDLVQSDFCNDLKDFQELIYVIKNLSTEMGIVTTTGANGLSALVKNIKAHKVLLVDGEGGIETVRSEIPVEAKKLFLELTRKAIFYFGEGVDVDADKFGNNPSGISLKFLYASLDLKANRLIRKFKKALKGFGWFVVTYINLRDRTKYDPNELTFTFNKSIIFNEKEKVDTLVASKGLLSRQTILENHPYVDDVPEEMRRLENEAADPIVNPPPEPELDEEGKPIMDENGQPVMKTNGQQKVAA